MEASLSKVEHQCLILPAKPAEHLCDSSAFHYCTLAYTCLTKYSCLEKPCRPVQSWYNKEKGNKTSVKQSQLGTVMSQMLEITTAARSLQTGTIVCHCLTPISSKPQQSFHPHVQALCALVLDKPLANRLFGPLRTPNGQVRRQKNRQGHHLQGQHLAANCKKH